MNELLKKRIWVGYSQREVAELAGVSRSTVSRLETGKQSPSRPKVEAALQKLLEESAQSNRSFGEGGLEGYARWEP